MSSNPVNVAVVGYGLSASKSQGAVLCRIYANSTPEVFHIPLILALPDEYKLYGIVQRSPKPNDDAAKDHVGIETWRSIEDVYGDPTVDVVVITSVPDTHFDMCKRSLEAGKNVIVEKPFVPTSQEAGQLADIAKKTGKKLAVYQNRRWDADFLTLKKIMDERLLGDVAEFETHFDRHRPDAPPLSWKNEAKPAHGSLYDLGTHL
jgi:predicted dehydrogenase